MCLLAVGQYDPVIFSVLCGLGWLLLTYVGDARRRYIGSSECNQTMLFLGFSCFFWRLMRSFLKFWIFLGLTGLFLFSCCLWRMSQTWQWLFLLSEVFSILYWIQPFTVHVSSTAFQIGLEQNPEQPTGVLTAFT